MKKYRVVFVAEAEDDLFDLYHFVAFYDSSDKADALLQKLETACASLATLPYRGHIPPELERIGLLDYREISYKPYRIIYQVRGKHVYIHGVLDGRRNMQELLQKRLLR